MLPLFAALTLVSAPTFAAPPTAPAAEAMRLERVERQALQTEMEQRLARTHQDVAALQAQCEVATDAALKNALQQRIEAAKREGQLDLFRIQLRHAQAAGRIAQVQELQAVLDHAAKLPVAPLAPLPAAAPRVAPAVAPARTVGKPVKGGVR
jgi:hypothetical protein